MEIKVKNYVVNESKTFTYTLKKVDEKDLINLLTILVKSNILFDFKSNVKSKVISFYVIYITDFNKIKLLFKSLVLKK